MVEVSYSELMQGRLRESAQRAREIADPKQLKGMDFDAIRLMFGQ